MADADKVAEKGMEVADMKRLLTKSKSEPVNVAVGLNGKDAVMLLHKQKQPKAVSKMLEDQFDDIKNLRWGTAFVDIDADPKLVILTLNRAISGMGTKLKKTLKGTGFSKVRIQTEDGGVVEDVGEEEQEQEGEAQQTAPNGQDTTEQVRERPQAQPSTQQAPPTQPQPQAQFNPAALTKRLGELVKQMLKAMQSQPDRAAELKQLAAAAQAAVTRGGDEQAATKAVDALEQALGGGAQGQQGAGGDGQAAARLQQSRIQWVSTRKQIEDEISKLHQAMAKHYEGHGFGADLDKIFSSKVQPILSSLDHSLADKLDEVGKATDPAQRSKLASEAQQVIAQYEQFVGGSQIISQLDQNPFVPIAIADTVKSTLDQLKASVQQVIQNVR